MGIVAASEASAGRIAFMMQDQIASFGRSLNHPSRIGAPLEWSAASGRAMVPTRVLSAAWCRRLAEAEQPSGTIRMIVLVKRTGTQTA
jgi:hypothetical protein